MMLIFWGIWASATPTLARLRKQTETTVVIATYRCWSFSLLAAR